VFGVRRCLSILRQLVVLFFPLSRVARKSSGWKTFSAERSRSRR